jgi:hypothetical protein
MGIDKLDKLGLIGGLLSIVLGVTNLIQLLIIGTSDPKAVALFGIYGLLFLIGGPVFLVLCIKDMNRPMMLIGEASTILFLMCPISNFIYITENSGLDAVLLSLSIINSILCIIALPFSFIRHTNLEDMDRREKISHVSLVLLRGSGIFHLLQPLLYGGSLETLGMLIFGIIYLTISALLVRRKNVNRVQWLGLIIPIIGAVLGIGLLFMSPTPYVIVFIIFDLIISPIRLYYIKTEPAE